jgi:hypothetical protein
VPSIEVELALLLIESRRRIHGAGVVAIDCSANIGIHTIEWATAMTEWGSVGGWFESHPRSQINRGLLMGHVAP